jgi:uncharacterized protein (TIGR03000 family)
MGVQVMTINGFKRAGATAVLTIAGLLLTVGQSHGQQNSTVFPWHAQAYRQGTDVDQSASRWNSFLPSAPALSPSSKVESRPAVYTDSSDADKVLIDVTVPVDAKIIFQGARTTQTGGTRRFVSPSLAPGYQYSYDVQATWMENGQGVSQSRSFTFRPGDVVHITFTREVVAARSGSIQTLKDHR